MQRVQAKWNRSQPDFKVVIRMSSTLTNVTWNDLKVYLETKKGNLPVKIESNGAFSVPMNEQLLEENPPIVVNQPKGTMALHWNVSFGNVPPMKNPVKYRQLLDCLYDAQDLQDEMMRAFPGATRMTFAGLKLTFPEGKENAVVIHAREGDNTLKLDEKREVIIARDSQLMDENPEISMPALPTKIEFAVRKE
jgi:hypothetical protein